MKKEKKIERRRWARPHLAGPELARSVQELAGAGWVMKPMQLIHALLGAVWSTRGSSARSRSRGWRHGRMATGARIGGEAGNSGSGGSGQDVKDEGEEEAGALAGVCEADHERRRRNLVAGTT